MDTRSKIAAAFPKDADVAEGFFDPLLASHAEQLEAMKSAKPLVAVIREPEQPLLDARARAELVAALRVVDAVVIGGTLTGRVLDEDPLQLIQVIRTKHGR